MAKRKKKRAIQTENKVKNGLKVIKLRYRKIDSKLGFFSARNLSLSQKKGKKIREENERDI